MVVKFFGKCGGIFLKGRIRLLSSVGRISLEEYFLPLFLGKLRKEKGKAFFCPGASNIAHNINMFPIFPLFRKGKRTRWNP